MVSWFRRRRWKRVAHCGDAIVSMVVLMSYIVDVCVAQYHLSPCPFLLVEIQQ